MVSPKSMNIGLAIDKKNGVESKVIGIQTKGSSPLAGNHNGNWCDNQQDGTFEIKKANTQNDYLKLIEEELKKQGVENIEWK